MGYSKEKRTHPLIGEIEGYIQRNVFLSPVINCEEARTRQGIRVIKHSNILPLIAKTNDAEPGMQKTYQGKKNLFKQ